MKLDETQAYQCTYLADVLYPLGKARGAASVMLTDHQMVAFDRAIAVAASIVLNKATVDG